MHHVTNTALIECVPNLSEGRRQSLIEGFAKTIRQSGVRLLDFSADDSHNRSVYTFAGEPAELERTVLALFERAIADIDLRRHVGVHPRIGAVDVVPFVPLDGAKMSACVDLARRVGAEVASRFDIPVFMYGEAASDQTRYKLEVIRKGGLEGLAGRLATAAWTPDFGPRHPHPTAGISAIGARPILVAYNVNLATTDLEIARRIASSVREANGGLPAVKALGLRLDSRGIVQVSMNLTDYARTSLPEAFESVRKAAERAGVSVLESEIIGLVPRAAFAGATPAELQLVDSGRTPILEDRLSEVARS